MFNGSLADPRLTGGVVDHIIADRTRLAGSERNDAFALRDSLPQGLERLYHVG